MRKENWDRVTEIGRPGGETQCAVFSGALIVRGSGIALVRATGKNTEIGKLGRSLQNMETESTNLERETKFVVRRFAAVSLIFCAVVAVGYWLTSGNWLQSALAGLALAISLIPEEFPVVLTVFLAIGAWRISQRRVLTRRVAAIETLGSATVLCVDKTGTITENRMSVREVFEVPLHDRHEVLDAAMRASANDPVDPMEKALHEAAGKVDGSTLVREYMLSNQLLAMSRVVDSGDGGYDVFAKGAPEAMARLCRLSADQILPHAEEMAGRGLRVLGVARRLSWRRRKCSQPIRLSIKWLQKRAQESNS